MSIFKASSSPEDYGARVAAAIAAPPPSAGSKRPAPTPAAPSALDALASLASAPPPAHAPKAFTSSTPSANNAEAPLPSASSSLSSITYSGPPLGAKSLPLSCPPLGAGGAPSHTISLPPFTVFLLSSPLLALVLPAGRSLPPPLLLRMSASTETSSTLDDPGLAVGASARATGVLRRWVAAEKDAGRAVRGFVGDVERALGRAP